MSEVAIIPEVPILKKEKTPHVRTPFVQKMFKVGEDEVYGLVVGFVSEGKVLPREHQNAPCMRLDDLILLSEQYSLMGVELIELQGGFGVLQGKQYLEMLEVLKKKFQIRVTRLGLQPAIADRLKPFVDGFGVDLKLVPKSSYSEEDANFYGKRFSLKRPLVEYAMMTERLAELVDGMDQTYYTSSTFEYLGHEDRVALLDFANRHKSPFMVGDKFLKQLCGDLSNAGSN